MSLAVACMESGTKLVSSSLVGDEVLQRSGITQVLYRERAIPHWVVGSTSKLKLVPFLSNGQSMIENLFLSRKCVVVGDFYWFKRNTKFNSLERSTNVASLFGHGHDCRSYC